MCIPVSKKNSKIVHHNTIYKKEKNKILYIKYMRKYPQKSTKFIRTPNSNISYKETTRNILRKLYEKKIRLKNIFQENLSACGDPH